MKASHEKIIQENNLAVISNSKVLFKDIQKAAEKVVELKGQRKAINDKIKAAREDLQGKGVDKKAFDHVLSYYEANLSDREGYLESRQMCMEALAETKDDLFSQDDVE